MNFSEALNALKESKCVSRSGWNGKGMWLTLVKSVTESEYYEPHYLVVGGKPEVASYTLLPWIGMKTADNGFVPWLASQTDLLAEDWGIV